MFLSDMDRSGIHHVRQMDAMDAMDACFIGGHGVLEFDRLRVPRGDVPGEVVKGFAHVQVRLAPARLRYRLRWLGQARRAHDTALDCACRRQAFGKPLAEHEGVGFMLADNDNDNDIDVHGAPEHPALRPAPRPGRQGGATSRAVPR